MRTSIIILCSLISAFALGQKHKTYREELQLKGKVKSLKFVYWNAYDSGSGLKKGAIVDQHCRIIFFNEKGERTEMYRLKPQQDSIKFEPEYQYVDSGGMKYTYEWDEESKVKYYEGKEIFDEHGNLTEEFHYNNSGKEIIHWKYVYDEKNRKKQGSLYRGDSLEETDRYIYIGNEDHCINEDGKGKVHDSAIFVKDVAGNCIKFEMFEPGNRFGSKSTSTYNKQGNPITEFYYSSADTIMEKYYYYYNKEGDEIECKDLDVTNNFKEVSKSKYTYDKAGNITEEITLNYNKIDNVKLGRIVECTLEYYK